MKYLRLNTLLVIFLFIFLIVTFLVLFTNSLQTYESFKKLIISNARTKTESFINSTFIEDVRQQAMKLNTVVKADIRGLKFLKHKLEQITDIKKTNNEKTNVFSNYKEFTINNYKFFFDVNCLKKKEKSEVNSKLLNNLHLLKVIMTEACFDPDDNAIISMFVISKDNCQIKLSRIKPSTDPIQLKQHLIKKTRELFAIKFNKNQLHYSLPYRDKEDKFLLSVCLPVYNKKNELNYIVGIELSRSNIISKLYDFFTKAPYSHYDLIRVLVDKDMNILYLPYKDVDFFSKNKTAELQKRYFYAGEAIKNYVTENKVTAKSGIINLSLNNENFLAGYSVLPCNEWTMIVFIKSKDIYKSLSATIKEVNKISQKTSIHYIIFFLLILFGTLIISYILFKYLFITPIETLRKNVMQLGEGNFDYKLKEEGVKEIVDLSVTFNTLGSSLKEYTKNLEKEIKERHTIETELKIAGQLQQSVLPKITKNFIRNEFELYAKLVPAQTMSGDFFDFFYIGKDKLVIVVADVMGKGISAAFYMSMSKAIIKNTCFTTDIEDPGKIIEEVNHILCKTTNSDIFITLYIAVYNINTGKIKYSNAGHHGYLKSDKNGTFSIKGGAHNLFAGIFDGLKYGYSEEQLNPGEVFGLFTDGITDAENNKNETYETDRLISQLNRNFKENQNLTKFGDIIINDTISFQTGHRFDDITLVLIKRNI